MDDKDWALLEKVEVGFETVDALTYDPSHTLDT
jgi:hypothetical protein